MIGCIEGGLTRRAVASLSLGLVVGLGGIGCDEGQEADDAAIVDAGTRDAAGGADRASDAEVADQQRAPDAAVDTASAPDAAPRVDASCPCDQNPTCDEGCACDSVCTNDCTCDVQAGCDTGCACDLMCYASGGLGLEACNHTVGALPFQLEADLAESALTLNGLPVDTYCVTATTSHTLVAETSAPTEGDDLYDTVLLLFDQGGGYVTFDDDGGEGTHSRISWSVAADGTYVIAVLPYNEAVMSDGTIYQISIEQQ